jgi:hypothetical protein
MDIKSVYKSINRLPIFTLFTLNVFSLHYIKWVDEQLFWGLLFETLVYIKDLRSTSKFIKCPEMHFSSSKFEGKTANQLEEGSHN